VLCDRYTDSTEAYQGHGRELGSRVVLSLHRELCGDLWPDLTLLLDSDLDASVFRARSRNQKAHSCEGRFEGENAAFFGRVRKGFESIALRETDRVMKIPSGSIHDVEVKVLQVIEERFPQLATRSLPLAKHDVRSS
jgi:dTMP kinase